MADQADVETALVTLLAGVFYPTSPAGPGSPSSVTNTVVVLTRGWPDPQSLDLVLRDGFVWVTVWPGPMHNTTRYARDWNALPIAGLSALTATVSGNVVTFSGALAVGQVVGLAIGSSVAPTAYAYRVQPTDTLASVAAAFASEVPGAGSSGASVSLPARTVVQAVSVVDQTGVLDLKQQSQQFRISVWAPNPTARDAAASAIDVAMALTEGITFADGTVSSPPVQAPGHTEESGSKDRLYRRDIVFLIDYSTVQIATQPSLLFGTYNIWANNYALVQSGSSNPTNNLLTDATQQFVFLDGAGNLVGSP